MMTNRKISMLSAFLTAALALACATPPATGATVVRDKYGVPHIQVDPEDSVENIKDLFRAYGKTVAEDRLFQIEMMRRAFEGTAAEVLGSEYVRADKMARLDIDLQALAAQIAHLPEKRKAILEGYVAGINDHLLAISKNPDALMPKEFTVMEIPLQKWRPVDVAAIFVGIFNGFGDFNSETQNLDFLKKLVATHGEVKGRAIFNKFFWVGDASAYSTAPEDQLGLLNGPDGESDDHIEMALAAAAQAPALLHKVAENSRLDFNVARSMSNAWLTTDLGKSAKAVFVNGPQPGWLNPSYFNEVELVGAGFDAIGLSFFGLPVVILGHNGKIAWGLTSANADQVDLFELTIRDNSGNLQYLVGGVWKTAICTDQTIEVKGSAPVRFPVCKTEYGTITGLDMKANKAMAKKRAWEGQELSSMMSWVAQTQATNYTEWRKAISGIAYGLSFFYTDTVGNIAYQLAGDYPLRARTRDFRLPAKGNGSMDWTGILPFEKNAAVPATRDGYIANWNNKPSPHWPNSDKYWSQWTEIDRVGAITRALDGLKNATPPEIWEVVARTSFSDLNIAYFLPAMKKAVANTSGNPATLVELLEKWNATGALRWMPFGDKPVVHPGEAIMDIWLQKLLEATIKPLLPDDKSTQRRFLATTRPTSSPQDGDQVKPGVRVVYRDLREWESFEAMKDLDSESRSSVGELSPFNVFAEKGAYAVIRETLGATYETLVEKFGKDPSNWNYGVMPQDFAATIWTGVPLALEKQQVPIYMNRGGANMMVVVTNRGVLKGCSVSPPGQSGFVDQNGKKSPHYSDQLALYQKFGCKPMERIFEQPREYEKTPSKL